MQLFSKTRFSPKNHPHEAALIALILLLVSLSVVFGFFDLEISKALADPDSPLGIFGQKYGEFPGYFIMATAMAAFFGSYFKSSKNQKIPALTLIILGIIYTIYMTLQNQQTNTILGLLTVATIILFTAATRKIDYKNYRTLALVILLLAFLNAFLFVQFSKTFFGRTRFRDLNPDFSNFTPWYIPQGITGNKSFPSGHTAMGFMLLPLLIPIRNLAWRNPKKTLTIILVIGWALFVGVSRVIAGAHYASDVLFSASIATIITLLLYRKFYHKPRQNNPLQL